LGSKKRNAFGVNDVQISDELQRFIARNIHSVEQIEILCLLAETPGRTWSENDVYRSIQSTPESVAMNLRHFANRGILTRAPDGFRFAPDSPELLRLSTALLHAYRARRVAIVDLIYKLLFKPARNFADAFRIRKEPGKEKEKEKDKDKP
jgi:hypothetical protein